MFEKLRNVWLSEESTAGPANLGIFSKMYGLEVWLAGLVRASSQRSSSFGQVATLRL